MLLPYVDRNLTLTGYSGADQTRISQRVAEQLKLRFVNVDLQLEARLEMSIDRFRSRFGEARLKTLESELMSEVLLNRSALLQVNGETLLRADYAKQLAATGPVICLTVSLGAALRRLRRRSGGCIWPWVRATTTPVNVRWPLVSSGGNALPRGAKASKNWMSPISVRTRSWKP